jgi:hypothetical protein
MGTGEGEKPDIRPPPKVFLEKKSKLKKKIRKYKKY